MVEHDSLIQKACYEESSYDLLIDEIEKYSNFVEDRRTLYQEILKRWNGRNVFDLVLDNGCFSIFNPEHYD